MDENRSKLQEYLERAIPVDGKKRPIPTRVWVNKRTGEVVPPTYPFDLKNWLHGIDIICILDTPANTDFFEDFEDYVDSMTLEEAESILESAEGWDEMDREARIALFGTDKKELYLKEQREAIILQSLSSIYPDVLQEEEEEGGEEGGEGSNSENPNPEGDGEDPEPPLE